MGTPLSSAMWLLTQFVNGNNFLVDRVIAHGFLVSYDLFLPVERSLNFENDRKYTILNKSWGDD